MSETPLRTRYNLERLLSEKETHTLHLATDAATGEMVVVRLIKSDVDPKSEYGLRFLRSTRLLGKLSHPALLIPIETGREDGAFFQVTPYYPTQTLAEILEERPLQSSEAISLFHQTAEALLRLHQVGVCHGNLKPSNLLITCIDDELRVAVTDAALPLLFPGRFPYGEPEDVAFISPEAEPSLDQDPGMSGDQYALGMIGYTLFTGKPPFQGGEHRKILKRHLSESTPDLSRSHPELPLALSSILRRLTAKLPIHRFLSMEGVLAELESIQGLDQPDPSNHVITGSAIRPSIVPQPAIQELLLSAFSRAGNGTGGLICLSTKEGIGKTTLLEHLLTKFVANDGLVLRAECNPPEWNAPFSTPLELLSDLQRQWEYLPVTRGHHLTKRLQTALEYHGSVITGLFPPLGDLLTGIGQSPSLPKEKESHRVQHALAETFYALAEPRHPLVIWIEHLEWADQDSLDWLRRLALGASRYPLLILTTIDKDKPVSQSVANWLKTVSPRIQTLELPPPSEEELSAHAKGQLEAWCPIASAEPEQMANQAAKLATLRWQANPLVMETAIRTWVVTNSKRQSPVNALVEHPGDNQVESPSDPVPSSTPTYGGDFSDLTELPEDHHDLLGIFRSHMDKSLIKVLEGISAFRGACEFSLLVNLMEEFSDIQILDLVEEGIGQDILYRKRGRICFRNTVWQEEIYSAMGETKKKNLHRAIGAFSETQPSNTAILHGHETASHFLHANDLQRIKKHGLIAAKTARHFFAIHGAATWYRHLIPNLGNDVTLPEVLFRLAECHLLLGEASAASDTLHHLESYDLTDDQTIELFQMQAWVDEMCGDPVEAVDKLELALETAGEQLPQRQVGLLLSRFGRSAKQQYAQFRVAVGGDAPPPPPPKLVRDAFLLERAAVTLGGFNPERADLTNEKILQMASGTQPVGWTVRALIRMAEASGDPEDPRFAHIETLTNHHRFPNEQAEMLAAKGRCLFSMMELAAARNALTKSHEIFANLGDPFGQAESLRWLAEIARIQGPFGPVIELGSQINEWGIVANALEYTLWGETLQRYGEGMTGRKSLDEAGTALRELANTAIEAGLGDCSHYAAFLSADMLLSHNRVADATQLLENFPESDEESRDYWELLLTSVRAECSLLLMQFRPEEQEVHLNRAIELAETLRAYEKAFPRLVIESLMIQSMVSLRSDRINEAIEQAQDAENLAEPHHPGLLLARLQQRVAEGLRSFDQPGWRGWAEKSKQGYERAAARRGAEQLQRMLENDIPDLSLEPKSVDIRPVTTVSGRGFAADLLESLEASLISGEVSSQNFYKVILRHSAFAVEASFAAFCTPDTNGRLTQVAQHLAQGREPLPISQWLLGTVWEEGKGEFLERFQLPDEDSSGPSIQQSAICVPVRGGGLPLGLLYLSSLAEEKNFSAKDVQLVQQMADQGGTVLATGNATEAAREGNLRLQRERDSIFSCLSWQADSTRAQGLGERREANLLQQFLSEVESANPFHIAALYSVDNDTHLTLGMSGTTKDEVLDWQESIPMDGSFPNLMQVLNTSRPIALSVHKQGDTTAETTFLSRLGVNWGAWIRHQENETQKGVMFLGASGSPPQPEDIAERLNPIRVVLPNLWLRYQLRSVNRELLDLRTERDSHKPVMERLSRFLPHHVQINDVRQNQLSGKEEHTPLLVGQIFDIARLARLGHQETLDHLKDYFQKVSSGLSMHSGILEKIEGQQWAARYGEGAESAIWGAETMFQYLDSFREERALFGSPMLRTGLGLHQGTTISGTLETENKSESILLGEGILVATKMAAMCRTFRTDVLVSEQVVERLETPDKFDLRPLGMFRIGPAETRVGVFELLSTKPEEIRSVMVERAELWDMALKHYQIGDWREAIPRLEEYLKAIPQDRAARQFLKHCQSKTRN